MKADRGGFWWSPTCLAQQLGWDLATCEPHCWIAGPWMESAAPWGDAVGQGRWWREPLGCWPLGRGVSLFSFLARVHSQFGEKFGETWAFLGIFRLILTPEGVQTAQGLDLGTVAHFPGKVFPFLSSQVPLWWPAGSATAAHRLLLPCQVSTAGDELIAGLGSFSPVL